MDASRLCSIGGQLQQAGTLEPTLLSTSNSGRGIFSHHPILPSIDGLAWTLGIPIKKELWMAYMLYRPDSPSCADIVLQSLLLEKWMEICSQDKNRVFSWMSIPINWCAEKALLWACVICQPKRVKQCALLLLLLLAVNNNNPRTWPLVTFCRYVTHRSRSREKGKCMSKMTWWI